MVETPQMSERENILTRIRQALTIPAGKPDGSGAQNAKAVAPEAEGGYASFLPATTTGFEEQRKQFQNNALELKAGFHFLENATEAANVLAIIRDAEGWKKVASHKGQLTLPACKALGLPTMIVDEAFDKNELETCDAGITECDALVAQTGSVLVTSRSAGGRALSVLPPHHIVLARRDQMVADLPAAFALLKRKYGVDFPSMMSFITGPSRTGDIERILVLGAHGPKKLTILCF
jgi:L-lactate dehydrogenase complex protein LldG